MAKGIVKGGLNDSGGGSGGDTSDATAVASDIMGGKTAYIAVGKVTGTLEVRNIADKLYLYQTVGGAL